MISPSTLVAFWLAVIPRPPAPTVIDSNLEYPMISHNPETVDAWRAAVPGTWVQRPVAALVDSLPWASAEVITQKAREAVAREWGEEADAVYVEWGSVRGGWEPPDRAEVHLLGTGSHGHWVALITDPLDPDRGTQVRLRTGVEILQPVAARGLNRGYTLTESDIRFETGIHWGSSKDVQFDVGPGWIAQAPVRQGQVLRPPVVGRPFAVVSGQPVEIVWARRGLSIRLKGRAAGNAALGESVYVWTETGKRLRGVAQELGVVGVTSQSTGGQR